jgi:alkanesulfonate monooxygenase SsuD/methylene tetrahydromethanopterin reductase-like flavin-dependent oxidoreductase (luciferase family)
MKDALCEPRPVQAKLPILVGGSGPRKTLRTTALRADAWNTAGTIDEVRKSVETLEGHCADVGRDPAEIERTVSFPTVIRDTRAAAEAAFGDLRAYNGVDASGGGLSLLGPPNELAETIRPYRELGFSTVIVRMPAPYDRETIDRIGEIRELLGDG